MSPLTDRDRNANSLLHLTKKRTSPRTDCPTKLPNAVPTPSQTAEARTEEQIAERKSRPLPESGNYIGSLGIALGMRLEMTDGSDAEKQAIIERFGKMRTFGDADDFLDELQKLQDSKLEKEAAERNAAEEKRMQAIRSLESETGN